MAEQFLDGPQVGPPLQEVRGEAMSERVGMDPVLDGHLADPGGDQAAHMSICQSTTIPVYQEGATPWPTAQPDRQVSVQRLFC